VSKTDPTEELRRLYPPILTTAHVAEMMHCTIGDVRDKVHRKELKAMRWGQQFRFFRDEVIATMTRVEPDETSDQDEDQREATDGDPS
jgi:excisionase family DNA binding protein